MRDFYSNLLSIQRHNDNANRTYDQGLNEASFMSYDEQKNYRMGAIEPKKLSKRDIRDIVGSSQILPASYHKVVKGVRNVPQKGDLKNLLNIDIE